MENKKICSHFIQKSIAKQWAVDKKVNFIIHNTLKEGSFYANSRAKKQPIAEDEFYSIEIEKSIGPIETKGAAIFKKILNNTNDEITITRKDVDIIKFYFLLTVYRSKLVRINLEKEIKSNDPFNFLVRNSNKNAKEIQEQIMRKIVKSYNEYNENKLFNDTSYFWKWISFITDMKKLKLKYNNDFWEWKNEIDNYFTLDSFIEIELIFLMLGSNLFFVKFEEEMLLLTETFSFKEYLSKSFPLEKYTFFVISPNTAIIFTKINLLNNYEQSEIFNFNLQDNPKIKLSKIVEIEKAKKLFLKKKNFKYKNNRKQNDINEKFHYEKELKFYTNEDQFEYKIHFENKATGIICNKNLLNDCKYSYVLYRRKDDYENAK